MELIRYKDTLFYTEKTDEGWQSHVIVESLVKKGKTEDEVMALAKQLIDSADDAKNMLPGKMGKDVVPVMVIAAIRAMAPSKEMVFGQALLAHEIGKCEARVFVESISGEKFSLRSMHHETR